MLCGHRNESSKTAAGPAEAFDAELLLSTVPRCWGVRAYGFTRDLPKLRVDVSAIVGQSAGNLNAVLVDDLSDMAEVTVVDEWFGGTGGRPRSPLKAGLILSLRTGLLPSHKMKISGLTRHAQARVLAQALHEQIRPGARPSRSA